MKGKILKKALAAALVLMLFAGTAPMSSFSGSFGDVSPSAQTMSLSRTKTKTS